MSGRTKARETIMERRSEIAGDTDPLFTEERSVGDFGGSLFHTIPSEARKRLGVEKGDNVKISIYRDMYVVRVKSEGGE